MARDIAALEWGSGPLMVRLEHLQRAQKQRISTLDRTPAQMFRMAARSCLDFMEQNKIAPAALKNYKTIFRSFGF